MKRIFAGIKLEPDNKFIELIDDIKLELRHENIRWVNTENYHITLKFFGNTDEEKIKKIESVFNNICTKYTPFNITVANTGTFERKGLPKILWFDTNQNEQLYKLVNEIEDGLVPLGYSKEKRPFKAHLTIGGIRNIKDKSVFNAVIEKYNNEYVQDVMVNRFILYESILKPGGPIYNELIDFKFND